MKLLKEIYFLLKRKLKETQRNPVFIFMAIGSPFLYLILFAPLLKNFSSFFPNQNVIDTFIPGMLVMISFFSGIFAGYGIIDELRSGIIERFRVTPISRFAILAGTVFRDMLTSISAVIVFVIISLFFGFKINVLGFFVIIILLSLLVIIASSFSNAIGIIVKSEDKLSPIIQGIQLPILLLSGILLPMSFAPNWLMKLAYFNPLYYVVEASRFLAIGDIFNKTVGLAFMIMILLTVIVMAWASKIFSRAVF